MNTRWIISLSLFYFFQLASGFAASYLPRYLGVIGMNGTLVGVTFGLQALARSIAMPVWSFASDRFGISARLVQLQFLMVLPAVALPWITHPNAVAALLILFGATVSCSIPITDVVTIRELKPTSFGRIRSVGSAGFGLTAAAFAIAGLSYSHTTLTQASVWVFVALFVASGLAAMGFPRSRASAHAINAADILRMFRNPWILVLVPLWTLHWAIQVPYNMYLVHYAEACGFQAWMPGASVFIGIIAEIAFLALGATLVDRAGPLLSFVVVVAATAARWALMSIVEEPLLVVALQCVHGLTFGGFMLSMMSVLNREVSSEIRSTAQAMLYVFVFGIGGIVGQLASGRWIDMYDAVSLFNAAAWLEVVLLVPTAIVTIYYRVKGRHRSSVLS